MAQAALKELSLQRILFIPTGAPRYRQPAAAAPEHRLAMLRLALAGEPRYQVDARELAPGASGYTVDTLSALRAELGPETALVLLIGADQLAKFGQWHRPQDVARLAELAAFARPGTVIDTKSTRVIPMEPMPISASAIRARAARGEDISGAVPPAVADYIARNRLYA
jgi:nicotinate-nucleotide adenylyltransferase